MRVVVVGGGFAGLAAGIALVERRHQVTLLERRGVLGGRASSYRDASSGEDVDNGTHLMIGAYADTLDLVRRAGAADLLLEQENLRIDYVDDRGLTALDCPPLLAPLHLLAGLLSLRLPWRVRFEAVRLGLAVRFGRHYLTVTECQPRPKVPSPQVTSRANRKAAAPRAKSQWMKNFQLTSPEKTALSAIGASPQLRPVKPIR